jgi:hypothetical protein
VESLRAAGWCICSGAGTELRCLNSNGERP